MVGRAGATTAEPLQAGGSRLTGQGGTCDKLAGTVAGHKVAIDVAAFCEGRRAEHGTLQDNIE
jgi:hypothetical protein